MPTRLPEGNRPSAEAHEHSGAMAKRDCGALGRKLPPRDPRSRHRTERVTSVAVDVRLRELLPLQGGKGGRDADKNRGGGRFDDFTQTAVEGADPPTASHTKKKD